MESGGITPRILNIGVRWDELLSSPLGRFNSEEGIPLRTVWEDRLNIAAEKSI